MDIKKVKLSELKPDKKNARKHDKRNIEEIKRSLQKNPQYRPFVVQKGTGRILVGNGMYQAMKELGITEGWAEYRDLTDEEATALALADNRTAELAEWDMSTLRDLFQEMGPDIDVPGWNADEIEDLFGLPTDGINTEIIEDEPPEPQQEAVSRPGDIWLLGKHRLMCGDSTKEDEVSALMNGAKADMMFTDPPWNVDYGNDKQHNTQGYKPRKILNDSMPAEKFRAFLDLAFSSAKHSLTGGGDGICRHERPRMGKRYGLLVVFGVSLVKYHYLVQRLSRVVQKRLPHTVRAYMVWMGRLFTQKTPAER